MNPDESLRSTDTNDGGRPSTDRYTQKKGESRKFKVDGFVNQVVDEHFEDAADKPSSSTLQSTVTDRNFGLFFGSLIMINATLLAWQTDHPDMSGLVSLGLETFFSMAFLVELVLKFAAFRWDFFYDPSSERGIQFWNIFDTILVTISVVDTFVLQTLSSSNGLESVLLLRMFRILRLARLVRLMRALHGLWLFIAAMYASFRLCMWTLVFSTLMIFICANFVVRSFEGVEDPEITRLFGTLQLTCYTLFRLVTLDQWYHDIAVPVMEQSDAGILAFPFYIGFLVYGIMQAATISVLTEQTVTRAQENVDEIARRREVKLKHAISVIHSVFIKSDRDGNGLLSKSEFQRAVRNSSAKSWLEELDIVVPDAEHLFEILDYDDSGTLSSNEFIEGCLRARGDATNKDLMSVNCDLWRNIRRFEKNVEECIESNTRRDLMMDEEIQKFDLLMSNLQSCVLQAHPAHFPEVRVENTPEQSFLSVAADDVERPSEQASPAQMVVVAEVNGSTASPSQNPRSGDEQLEPTPVHDGIRPLVVSTQEPGHELRNEPPPEGSNDHSPLGPVPNGTISNL